MVLGFTEVPASGVGEGVAAGQIPGRLAGVVDDPVEGVGEFGVHLLDPGDLVAAVDRIAHRGPGGVRTLVHPESLGRPRFDPGQTLVITVSRTHVASAGPGGQGDQTQRLVLLHRLRGEPVEPGDRSGAGHHDPLYVGGVDVVWRAALDRYRRVALRAGDEGSHLQTGACSQQKITACARIDHHLRPDRCGIGDPRPARNDLPRFGGGPQRGPAAGLIRREIAGDRVVGGDLERFSQLHLPGVDPDDVVAQHVRLHGDVDLADGQWRHGQSKQRIEEQAIVHARLQVRVADAVEGLARQGPRQTHRAHAPASW